MQERWVGWRLCGVVWQSLAGVEASRRVHWGGGGGDERCPVFAGGCGWVGGGCVGGGECGGGWVCVCVWGGGGGGGAESTGAMRHERTHWVGLPCGYAPSHRPHAQSREDAAERAAEETRKRESIQAAIQARRTQSTEPAADPMQLMQLRQSQARASAGQEALQAGAQDAAAAADAKPAGAQQVAPAAAEAAPRPDDSMAPPAHQPAPEQQPASTATPVAVPAQPAEQPAAGGAWADMPASPAASQQEAQPDGEQPEAVQQPAAKKQLPAAEEQQAAAEQQEAAVVAPPADVRAEQAERRTPLQVDVGEDEASPAAASPEGSASAAEQLTPSPAAAAEQQPGAGATPATPPGLLAAVLGFADGWGGMWGGASQEPARPAAGAAPMAAEPAAAASDEPGEQRSSGSVGEGWDSPGSSLDEAAYTALSQLPPGTAALATVAASRPSRLEEAFVTPLPQPNWSPVASAEAAAAEGVASSDRVAGGAIAPADGDSAASAAKRS